MQLFLYILLEIIRYWLIKILAEMQMLFQESSAKENGSESKVMSAEQAEDLKMKEKRKREREVLLILCVFVNLSTKFCSTYHSSVSFVYRIVIEKSPEEEKEEVGGCTRAIRR